jgi:hypothetical protein
MFAESILQRLKFQHLSIAEIISGVTESKMQLSENGKWSIHDNIAHLAKYQPVFNERIKQIVQEEGKVYERYSAETDPEFESWRSRSSKMLLEQLSADRIKLINHLQNLSSFEISRTGIHKVFGPMTVKQWTEFFLLHEAHHMLTIFRLVHSPDK